MPASDIRILLYLYDEREFLTHVLRDHVASDDRNMVEVLVRRRGLIERTIAQGEAEGRVPYPGAGSKR